MHQWEFENSPNVWQGRAVFIVASGLFLESWESILLGWFGLP